MRQRVIVSACLAAALLAALPAAADWIVTRDGDRLETRGAWEVKGKMVVFTLPNGTLSSLPAAEVDLEASRQATDAARAAAERPADAEERPRREPVLVLTDRDVRRAVPLAAAPPDEGEADEGAEEGPPTEGLRVSDWRTVGDDEGFGMRAMGVLRNVSPHVAAGIILTVGVYDAEGVLLQQADAQLDATALRPQQTTQFVAEIPGVRTYTSIRFEADARWLRIEEGGEDAPIPN